MAQAANPCNIVVGPVRLSYLHVFEPWKSDDSDDDKLKYTASLIIPKTDKGLIKKIEAAVEMAKEAGKDTKFKGKIPKTLKLPLRDGDEEREDDEAYKNTFFLNANSSTRPGLVDAARNVITDQDELYSGCYGYVNVTFFAYTTGGKPGVACGLNHIMKFKDGEPLSGKVSLSSAFEGIDIDPAADEFM